MKMTEPTIGGSNLMLTMTGHVTEKWRMKKISLVRIQKLQNEKWDDYCVKKLLSEN